MSVTNERIDAILARIGSEAIRPDFSPDLLATVPTTGPVSKREFRGIRRPEYVPTERYTRSDRTTGIRAIPVRSTEPRDYRGGYVNGR